MKNKIPCDDLFVLSKNYREINKAIDFYTKAIEVVNSKAPSYWLISVYKLRREAYLQLGKKEEADIDLKLMKETEINNKKEGNGTTF